MSFRIVATSDSHLGRYYARMPVRILAERRRHLRQALGRVVDHAVASQADLFILAGDVFDSPNPMNTDRIYLARKLQELKNAGIPVVAVGGNHDTPRSMTEQGGYLPLSIYAELQALTFFDLLEPDDLTIRPILFNDEELRIAVGGFTPNVNLGPEHDLLDGINFDDSEADVRVLVVHGPLEGMIYSGASSPLIHRKSVEQLRGVNLIIAGDIHQRAALSIGGKNVVVPGATEWFDYGEWENTRPGFAEIEIRSHTDIEVRHVDLAPQPRSHITVSASELDHEDHREDLTGYVLSQLPESDPEKLVRLSVEGTVSRDIYLRLNQAAIEEYARQQFFFFEIDLSHLVVQFHVDGEAIDVSPRRSIREEINAVVNSQLEQIEEPHQRDLLEQTRQALLKERIASREDLREKLHDVQRNIEVDEKRITQRHREMKALEKLQDLLPDMLDPESEAALKEAIQAKRST